MLNKKQNAKLLWMQFEDVLAPRLGPTVKERAVYSYLLRHSLVVGKLRLQFAVMSLARTLGLSIGAARHAVRRLDELGTLRVLKRSKTGHLAEMRLAEKIRALRPGKNGALLTTGAVGVGTTGAAGEPPAATLETRDFLKTWALRKTIHVREREWFCGAPRSSRNPWFRASRQAAPPRPPWSPPPQPPWSITRHFCPGGAPRSSPPGASPRHGRSCCA